MQKKFPLEKVSEKILNFDSLKAFLEEKKGNKLIFTNGCFDLLHYGHLYYLAEASQM